MKKIFLAMAIAFAITTAMTITTVIAYTDQSSAWEYASRSAKGAAALGDQDPATPTRTPTAD
jgi:hypothetical protein